jgi:hypothetical protein
MELNEKSKGGKTIRIVAVALVVVLVAAYILFKRPALAPGTAAATGATSRPTTPSAMARSAASRAKTVATKTVEAPFLKSPKEMGQPTDPRVGGLIDGHNKFQDKLVKVSLKGTCAWTFDGETGTPRRMTVFFDRAIGQAAITCGTDRCTVDGGRVTMNSASAMHIDALYLLIFRKYNPADFTLDTASSDETKVVAASKLEKLTFDAETGRLVESEVTSDKGAVVVQFEGSIPIGESEASAPATVRVVPPVKMLPFPVKQPGGTVTFAINEGRAE